MRGMPPPFSCIQWPMMAVGAEETVELFLPRSCQNVASANLAPQVSFVKLEVVLSFNRSLLHVQEVMDDFKPSLFVLFGQNGLSAGCIEAFLDFLEERFGVKPVPT